MPDLPALRDAVQQNCHISDSLYAQNYGLCTYLLKMREFYRWEQRLPLTARLPTDAVAGWVEERESLWEKLEKAEFQPLSVAGAAFDPFDSAAINRALLAQDLVYSGGYGQFCKPSFFLGQLEKYEQRDGLEIWIAGVEYARDLAAPPAMSQGNAVFIRRESLRRHLWERVEEWQWKKAKVPPFSQLLQLYHCADGMEAALDRMAQDEIASLIDHETGEAEAGKLLGAEWEAMLRDLAGSKAELVARAARDHLADCLITLPCLLEIRDQGRLLFYLANLKGMRKALFPRLQQAYQDWLASGDLAALAAATAAGRGHWLRHSRQMLRLYHANPATAVARIGELQEPIAL
jgi:hypothetical protein